ncbi:lysozyme family protein [Vagococcus xieshaowenii]|uniref:Lysozyme family protein n=1 Tax=Vagococcus xieshaowenii TaxID=2562451 RepID=A0AAJ5EEG8_9ENTE|nr:lysozyme family protein [Vagococcus xieshaowenii]QCA28680.1 lysozyme family protein [Vagococcus xieshaowenii]TFZ40512.1 lysozyme family protein [Vagococcus xieshaowenii]
MTKNKKRRRHLGKKIMTLFLLSILSCGLFLGIKAKHHVDRVLTWSEDVERISTNNNIQDYQLLIEAIILMESKGNKTDLMQSSESRYGKVGNISSEQESLEAGINFLAQAIELGKEQHVDIWTSVQAYNFGLNYIYYVSENGGKNSLELAETYSKEVLAPTLGNNKLETYSYKMPHAIVYNGGYLYKNGGNFFYADMVKWYQKMIQGLS